MKDPIIIPKKQLVIFAGLAAVGKRTTIDKLVQNIANAAKFEKDLVNIVFLPTEESGTEQYKQLSPVINSKTYDLIIKQALDNIKGAETHKVAILQAYFGDKIASKYEQLISSTQYEVKIVYLHCSGPTQKFRITQRGLERDADKVLDVRDPDTINSSTVDPFPAYRKQHLQNHLRELARIPAENLLIIDTEADMDIDANVSKIIEFLQFDSPMLKVTPLANIDSSAITVLPDEAVCGFDANAFKTKLAKIKGTDVDFVDATKHIRTASNLSIETPVNWMLAKYNSSKDAVNSFFCPEPQQACNDQVPGLKHLF